MIRPIQYLRGLAALTVVWLHALHIVPGVVDKLGPSYFGAAGVDLFFVISGFIMVATTTGKSLTPRAFFTMRIVRVVPLYWLATLAIVAIAASGHLFRDLRYTPQAIAKSLFFVPYWSLDYPGQVWPVLLQGWSLNYEMAFYLLFAVSLKIPARFRIWIMCAVLAFCVLLGKVFGPFQSAEASIYTSPMLLEFAAGMIIARLYLRGGWRFPALGAWCSVAFGVFLLGSLQSPALLLTGASLIVMGALHPKICTIQNRPLLEMGNASYSMYLIHPFILAPLAFAWVHVIHQATALSSMGFMLISCVLCLLAGWACYRFIEKPMTNCLHVMLRPKLAVATGLVAVKS